MQESISWVDVDEYMHRYDYDAGMRHFSGWAEGDFVSFEHAGRKYILEYFKNLSEIKEFMEWVAGSNRLGALLTYFYNIEATNMGLYMSPCCHCCGQINSLISERIVIPTIEQPCRNIRASYVLRNMLAGKAVQNGWLVTSTGFYCPDCQQVFARLR